MLFVDGMLGVVAHSETVQWLYTLCASLVRAPTQPSTLSPLYLE